MSEEFIEPFTNTMTKLDELNNYLYDTEIFEKNTNFYKTVNNDLSIIQNQIKEILELLTTLHKTIVSSNDQRNSNEIKISQLEEQIKILEQQKQQESVVIPNTEAINTEMDKKSAEINKLNDKNIEYAKLIQKSTGIMQKSISILQNLQNNSDINKKDQIEINIIIKNITDSVKKINEQISQNNNYTFEGNAKDAFIKNPITTKLSDSEKNKYKNFNKNPINPLSFKPNPPSSPSRKILKPLDDLTSMLSGDDTSPKLDGGTRRKRKSKKQKRKTKKPKRKTQKKKRKTHRKH